MQDVVIALDVGGTAVKGALLRRDGNCADATTVATGTDAVASVLELAATLYARARRTGRAPVAAGVAVPGVVDEERGVAIEAVNLGWRDVPLRDLLVGRMDLPVTVGHDVRAGGLAEARLGTGRGWPVFLFVAVGTGIAAALALEGTVLRGGHGRAGELGHVVVRPDGPACACGQHGCVETIASAAAISRRYAQQSGAAATAEEVAARAAAGDAIAATIWAEAVAALADGLVCAQSLFDPQVVSLGGGLARSGEQLLGPLRTAVRRRLTFQAMPKILGAELGYLAGCQGAGLLAFDASSRAAGSGPPGPPAEESS
jgi:glucokinase